MKKKGKLRTYSATFFSNAPKIFPQECHIFTTRAPETPKTLYMPLMRSSIYCLSPFDHAKFGTLQLITVMYQQQWNRISSFKSCIAFEEWKYDVAKTYIIDGVHMLISHTVWCRSWLSYDVTELHLGCTVVYVLKQAFLKKGCCHSVIFACLLLICPFIHIANIFFVAVYTIHSIL